MNDKEIMTNILNAVKGECDLLMHGAIESSTSNVHKVFDQALKDSLCMQDEIYRKMSDKGWYPSTQANEQEIMKVKNRYAASMS